MKTLALSLASFALVGASTASLGAQTSSREISLAAGISQFDASGTGTAPLVALRIATPFVGRWLLGDFSLSYASLDEQFSSVNTRTGVAEGQLQVQLPAASLRPYVGLGGGWLHYFNNSSGRTATPPTLSGSVGLRVPVSSALLLRGELRLRTWASGQNSGFHNNAAEFTAGLGYAF